MKRGGTKLNLWGSIVYKYGGRSDLTTLLTSTQEEEPRSSPTPSRRHLPLSLSLNFLAPFLDPRPKKGKVERESIITSMALSLIFTCTRIFLFLTILFAY